MKKRPVVNQNTTPAAAPTKKDGNYMPQSRQLVPLRVDSSFSNTEEDASKKESLLSAADAGPAINQDETTAHTQKNTPIDQIHQTAANSSENMQEATEDEVLLDTLPDSAAANNEASSDEETAFLYRAIQQGSLFVKNNYNENEEKPTRPPDLNQTLLILEPDRILAMEEESSSTKEKSLFTLAAEQESQPYLPKNAQEAFYLVAPGLSNDPALLKSMGRLLQDVEPTESVEPTSLVRPVQLNLNTESKAEETSPNKESQHFDAPEVNTESFIATNEDTADKTTVEENSFATTTDDNSLEGVLHPAEQETTGKDIGKDIGEKSGDATLIKDTGLPVEMPHTLTMQEKPESATDKEAEEIAAYLTQKLAADQKADFVTNKEQANLPQATTKDKVSAAKKETPKTTKEKPFKRKIKSPKNWFVENRFISKAKKNELQKMSAIELATATRAKLLAQNTIQEASGSLYLRCFIPAALLYLFQYWYFHNLDHKPIELVLGYGLGNLLLYAFSLVLPMTIAMRKQNYSFNFIAGKHSPSPATLVLSGLITLPVLLLLTGLNHILNYGLIYFRLTNAQVDWLSGLNLMQNLPGTSSFLLTLVLFGLLEPLLEELFFRGFLQNMLAASNHIRLAIVLQALAYALYKPQPLFWLFPLFTGLFLGYLRYTMQSLWPCLISHIILNLGGIFLFRALPSFIADPLLIGTKTGAASLQASFVTVVLALLILMPTLRLLRHFQPQPQPKHPLQMIQPTTWVFYLSCLGFFLLKLFL